MDFTFTEDQKMLRQAARDFLEAECPKSLVKKVEASELGYSGELWQKIVAMGWTGLVLPEEHGGTGGSLLELGILFEELGRATCPLPLFSTIALGAFPIMKFGSDEQKKQLLPKVAGPELSCNALARR